MRSLLRSLWQNESGAVTIDWVVLSAAVVAAALLIVSDIGSRINSASGEIGTHLETTVNNSVTGTISDYQN
ncbi:hypothetical protein [Acidimangrovimonas sediminis]|uniref:hypothetical protein n=1 Tax=Acidimangrovimonas sediminis TaxID=2056283 RepID=UPI000C80D9E0|nr:hypothetical protein [Acidimangrovimonas sediminis]